MPVPRGAPGRRESLQLPAAGESRIYLSLLRRALKTLKTRWDRHLTAETRRKIDDAATAGLSLIDLDRSRAGAPAAHDRPHCRAVEIIALRQVVDADESHVNLLRCREL